MQTNDAIDLLLEEFNLPEGERQPRKGVTYWVPEDIHLAYQEIQSKTQRGFGKSVEQLLVEMIRRKHAKLFKKSA